MVGFRSTVFGLVEQVLQRSVDDGVNANTARDEHMYKMFSAPRQIFIGDRSLHGSRTKVNVFYRPSYVHESGFVSTTVQFNSVASDHFSTGLGEEGVEMSIVISLITIV